MDEFTHDDYEAMLNDIYPPAVVLGVEIGYGTIARQCEPIGFVHAFNEFVNAQREELTD